MDHNSEENKMANSVIFFYRPQAWFAKCDSFNGGLLLQDRTIFWSGKKAPAAPALPSQKIQIYFFLHLGDDISTCINKKLSKK